jgi:hypothetical protein
VPEPHFAMRASCVAEGVSRGYWGIREITERMQPLVDWTKQFKPKQQCLRLVKKDYDLIKRWPKAGHSLGIDYTLTEIWWQGLELVYDASLGRYTQPPVPEQTDLEDLCRK